MSNKARLTTYDGGCSHTKSIGYKDEDSYTNDFGYEFLKYKNDLYIRDCPEDNFEPATAFKIKAAFNPDFAAFINWCEKENTPTWFERNKEDIF